MAGYDTTGTTLAFACYDLAKNPDVQEKLREEVEEILGDSDRDLTYDDLQSMTYVDQIIRYLTKNSDSKLFFHPAKFDNFKDEKISDYKTDSVAQSKNLLD